MTMLVYLMNSVWCCGSQIVLYDFQLKPCSGRCFAKKSTVERYYIINHVAETQGESTNTEFRSCYSIEASNIGVLLECTLHVLLDQAHMIPLRQYSFVKVGSTASAKSRKFAHE